MEVSKAWKTLSYEASKLYNWVSNKKKENNIYNIININIKWIKNLLHFSGVFLFLFFLALRHHSYSTSSIFKMMVELATLT